MPEIKQDLRAATLIVAANNSLHKNMADYVCDGINDEVEIQSALNALPANGGEVKLLDGTYTVEFGITLPSACTLSGCGANTILRMINGKNGNINMLSNSGNNRIVVKDLKLDGNKAARVGGTHHGIYFTSVGSGVGDAAIQGCQIEDCHIEDFYNGGIILKTSYNCVVSNNMLHGCDYQIVPDTCARITIVGNTAQSSRDSGIRVWATTDSVIADNICQGVGGYGIFLSGVSARNTIKGNNCTNSGSGIHSEGASTKNAIVGNSCCQNVYGIRIAGGSTYTLIAGNFCGDNTEPGISLENGSNHNLVIGNTCFANSQLTHNTKDGIILSDSDYNLISGNTVRKGTGAKMQRYGINISDVDSVKNIVSDNDLYDGGQTANLNDVGTLTHVEDNNVGIEITQIKHFRRVKNTSGAQRVAGDVVSLKAVAAGNEVTAPVAIGERQVYGMVAETINDNTSGLVLVKGFTNALKATNVGGGNIAIGDFLITENGVRARKNAAATDPIFARALESCAVADAVIDAFIISPWD